jgi:hypothetical protein
MQMGFPAVIQCSHEFDNFKSYHLSASWGDRYYISKSFDTNNIRELEVWFGKEIAEKIKNLKAGEGVHCRLCPVIAELNEKEVKQIIEHTARTIVKLPE